jgi:hypothetical protein
VTYSNGNKMQLGKLSRPPASHETQNILASARLRGAGSYLQNRVDGVELIQAIVW